MVTVSVWSKTLRVANGVGQMFLNKSDVKINAVIMTRCGAIMTAER